MNGQDYKIKGKKIAYFVHLKQSCPFIHFSLGEISNEK
jgi:hypothetical protein